MTTITVNVDDEVYLRFRKLAEDEKKGKKGFLGDTISEALSEYVKKKEADEAIATMRAIMKRGIRIGFRGYKSRDELYDDRFRHILHDRH